jgi:hypothetical protein
LLMACLLPVQAGKYKGLWLKMSDETAPAGGVAQVRLTLTEPKPIIRTRMDLEFDEAIVGDVLSVSIFSGNGEASGTAVRMGKRLHIEAESPSANWGMDENLPLLTVAVQLRHDAPAGTSSVFRILPESVFYEVDGGQWKVEDNAPGSVAVGPDFTINEVVPSGGFIQPGQTIRVLGRGFAPGTLAGIDSVPDVASTWVSENEMTLVAPSAFQLDQRRVVVVDPWTRERSFFPSLQGFENSQSLYDLLWATRPLFSPRAMTSASFTVPDDLSGWDRFAGVALQNPTADQATVRVSAISVDGQSLGTAQLTLLGTERILRDLSEILPGVKLAAGAGLMIESDTPLQMMGLAGNLTTARVLPLTPNAPPADPAQQDK